MVRTSKTRFCKVLIFFIKKYLGYFHGYPFQHSILGAARVLVGAVSNGVERGEGEAAGRVEEDIARKACMGFRLI